MSSDVTLCPHTDVQLIPQSHNTKHFLIHSEPQTVRALSAPFQQRCVYADHIRTKVKLLHGLSYTERLNSELDAALHVNRAAKQPETLGVTSGSCSPAGSRMMDKLGGAWKSGSPP